MDDKRNAFQKTWPEIGAWIGLMAVPLLIFGAAVSYVQMRRGWHMGLDCVQGKTSGIGNVTDPDAYTPREAIEAAVRTCRNRISW